MLEHVHGEDGVDGEISRDVVHRREERLDAPRLSDEGTVAGARLDRHDRPLARRGAGEQVPGTGADLEHRGAGKVEAVPRFDGRLGSMASDDTVQEVVFLKRLVMEALERIVVDISIDRPARAAPHELGAEAVTESLSDA